MKIAFIAEHRFGAKKNTRKIALAMTKSGSEVFFYVTKGSSIYIFWATLKAFFKGCDVIHFEEGKKNYAKTLAKIFFPKTIIVSMDDLQCPFIPKPVSAPKKNMPVYSISELGLRSKKYILAETILEKSEGMHFLIDAFKQLENTAKTPNNFKLVIIAHEKKDDDYERYVRHICEGRPNIVILYDQPKGMIEMLYANAYLFVQTSVAPQSLEITRKAMEYSLAVVAADSPENMQLLDGGGVSFSLKNPNDLRDRLAFLLSRGDAVERIGKLTRKKLESEYSPQTIANKSVESYKLMYSKK